MLLLCLSHNYIQFCSQHYRAFKTHPFDHFQFAPYEFEWEIR
jgi:hypothetical protein